MRTIDILPLANDAPLADIDLGALSRETARGLNIVLACAALAIALTGAVPLDLARWMLIGAAPSLSAALIWPMFERRGLDRTRIGREPVGMWATLSSVALAVGIMLTIGQTMNDGREWPYLLQLLAIPFMLDYAAAHARFVHWMDDAKAEG